MVVDMNDMQVEFISILLEFLMQFLAMALGVVGGRYLPRG